MKAISTKKETKLDMTHGPIMKLVILFAIPMVIGNILQQLYTTVDTLVIGNFCGHTSIAAIGTSSQPLEVFMCIFMGIGSGVSILVSRCTGAGNREELQKIINGATSFTYLVAIPLTAVGIILTPAILHLMQVPADTWDPAVLYIRIVFLGLLGNMGYNMNAGILRGLGDSVASLVFLVISCLTNVVLDFVFVAGFGMDKTTATISMHERDADGNWMQILSTPGYVGKNGLCLDEDHKEGCGQTPVGVYHFNKAFGIAPDPGCAMPYLQVDDEIYWSGDMRDGMHYNEMVNINDYPDLDMENSEHIIDYEYQYQYCLNISFNEDGTAGRGSAIFLHCFGPVKPYTGGCVAVPEYIMVQIMQRVDPDCVVVIDTVDNLNVTF